MAQPRVLLPLNLAHDGGRHDGRLELVEGPASLDGLRLPGVAEEDDARATLIGESECLLHLARWDGARLVDDEHRARVEDLLARGEERRGRLRLDAKLP